MVWKGPSERMTREQGTRRAARESHRDLEEDHSRWREQHVQRSSGWKDNGCMWKQTVGGQQWWEGGQQEAVAGAQKGDGGGLGPDDAGGGGEVV